MICDQILYSKKSAHFSSVNPGIPLKRICTILHIISNVQKATFSEKLEDTFNEYFQITVEETLLTRTKFQKFNRQEHSSGCHSYMIVDSKGIKTTLIELSISIYSAQSSNYG
jgi:hypothetical protein